MHSLSKHFVESFDGEMMILLKYNSDVTSLTPFKRLARDTLYGYSIITKKQFQSSISSLKISTDGCLVTG